MSQKEPVKPWYTRLESCDLFGIPIRFHIHQQPSYRTSLSGFLSLVLILGLTVYTITTVINAIYYSHIDFLSTKELSTTETIDFNASNFFMAVKVPDLMYSNDQALYSVNFEYITSDPSITESLGVVQCSADDISLHASEVTKSELENMFCPKLKDYSLGAQDSKYIRITVKRCQNATDSSIICASQEDIDSYFSGPNITQPLTATIYVTNNLLNMLSTTPNVRYLKRLDIKAPGGNLARQSDFYVYEEIVTIEDNALNYLKKGIDANNSFAFDERIQDQLVYTNEGSFLEVNIKKNDIDVRYLRSFTNIGDILAFIGGLSKVLVIILSVIVIPYNEFHYNLAISNEIYEFESRPKFFYKKTLQTNGKKKFKKSITFSDLEALTKVDPSPSSKGSGDAQNRWLVHKEKVSQYHPFFESLKNRHQRLVYSTKDLFKKLLFWFKGRNMKIKDDLYKQARRHLRKDIDIITVLKKLQDVDKLKQLILNSQQIELFNYKRPLRIEYFRQFKMLNQVPMISKRTKDSIQSKDDTLSQVKSSLYLPDQPLENISQFKSLFEAYKVSKDNSTKLDSKLVQMLGPELLSIFNRLDEDYQNEMANITQKSGNLGDSDMTIPGPNKRDGSAHNYSSFKKVQTLNDRTEVEGYSEMIKKMSIFPDQDLFAEVEGNTNTLIEVNKEDREDIGETRTAADDAERPRKIAKIPISLTFSRANM